jgi:hypothetical protein
MDRFNLEQAIMKENENVQKRFLSDLKEGEAAVITRVKGY